MKLKKEFNKNMKYGFLAIAIGLIFFTGFYIHAVSLDFNKECASCITQNCMDNDLLCGDFGTYYWRFGALITMGMFGFLLIIGEKQWQK